MSECASRQHACFGSFKLSISKNRRETLVRSGMRRRHQKKALPTKTPVEEDEDVILVRTLERSSLKSESPNLPVPARKNNNGVHI